MIVSAEALGLEEDLSGVEGSVADLITAEEAEDMASTSKTWDFWAFAHDQRHDRGFAEAGLLQGC